MAWSPCAAAAAVAVIQDIPLTWEPAAAAAAGADVLRKGDETGGRERGSGNWEDVRCGLAGTHSEVTLLRPPPTQNVTSLFFLFLATRNQWPSP